MRGWGIVLGVIGGLALVAVVLKVLPPPAVLLLFAAGGGYGAWRYRETVRRAKEEVDARALGFERATSDRFGLTTPSLTLLARGGGATVSELMLGPWRGGEAKVFRADYVDATGAGHVLRCALVPLDGSVTPLVVEPRVFFTPQIDLAGLVPVSTGDAAFDDRFDARAEDPDAARGVLVGPVLAAVAAGADTYGFELRERMALCYTPADRPPREVLAELEQLVDALPTGRTAGATVPERPSEARPGNHEVGE